MKEIRSDFKVIVLKTNNKMYTREKLNEFAELRGWNKNKLIGWSEAADFGDWLVKNCSIPVKHGKSKLEIQQQQLDIPVIMRLLSNENMYAKSGLHSSEIGDNGELRRVSIKETSFETGFMCARKIILDVLNNNA